MVIGLKAQLLFEIYIEVIDAFAMPLLYKSLLKASSWLEVNPYKGQSDGHSIEYDPLSLIRPYIIHGEPKPYRDYRPYQ